MDYVILNDMVLQLVIEDHPPRRNTKNFNAHLALTLKCKKVPAIVEGASNSGRPGFHWVPVMEGTWREWTDTTDFA